MFREIILPIFRSTRLCVTVCGIMHPRCCRPPAGNIVFSQIIPQRTQNTKCLKHPSFVGDVVIMQRIRKKGKVVPSYARKAYRISTWWTWVISLTPSSSDTLKRMGGAQCTGGYVGPRAGMDVSQKRKSHAPAGIRTPDGIDRSQVVKHSNFTYFIAKNTQITKIRVI